MKSIFRGDFIIEYVGEVVSQQQMQKRIEKHRAVAGGEHETITIRPAGVGHVVFQHFGEKRGRDISRAHGQAWMAGFGFFDRIHCQPVLHLGKTATAPFAPIVALAGRANGDARRIRRGVVPSVPRGAGCGGG